MVQTSEPVPFPLLAHQAPVLPLKLRWPHAWNATALVVGSLAPDLEYLRLSVRVDSHTGFAHSLVGQFVFCLPVTLAVVWLVGRFQLGAVLVARASPRARVLAGAATDVVQPGGLRRAIVSALVGSFSHVALDRFTHDVIPSFFPDHVFHVGTMRCGVPALVQLIVTVPASLYSLWALRTLARRAEGVVVEKRPGRGLLLACCAAGAALGLRADRPVLRDPDSYLDAGRVYIWGQASFFVAVWAGGAMLVALLLLAARDRRVAST